MTTRVFIQAFLLSIILCGGLLAQSPTASPPSSIPNSQSPAVSGSDQSQTQRNQAGAASRSAIQESTNQTPQQQGTGRNSREHENEVGVGHGDESSPDYLTAKFTFWLVIGTAILAVATLALAVATIGLYRQTRRLADLAAEASKDTQRSIEIAERHADASSRAAQSAYDALASERAWITYSDLGFGPVNNATVGGKFVANGVFMLINFLNTGKSPCKILEAQQEKRLIDPGEAVPRFELMKSQNQSETIVGPGAQAAPQTVFFNDEERIAFMNSTKDIVVYIRFDYKTVFDKENISRTEVCLRVRYSGGRISFDGRDTPPILIFFEGEQNTFI